MSVFLIAVFSMLFIVGIGILFSAVAKYASYAVAEGKVVKLLACNPCLEQGVEVEAGTNDKPLAAVIAYGVGADSYQLIVEHNKRLLKSGRSRCGIQVFYNPYKPAEARLKGRSPFLPGALLVATSLLGIVLAFIF
jgi:hypothetical protein